MRDTHPQRNVVARQSNTCHWCAADDGNSLQALHHRPVVVVLYNVIKPTFRQTIRSLLTLIINHWLLITIGSYCVRCEIISYVSANRYFCKCWWRLRNWLADRHKPHIDFVYSLFTLAVLSVFVFRSIYADIFHTCDWLQHCWNFVDIWNVPP